MYGYHVAAVFGSYDAAEQAKSRLRNAGVSDSNIHLSHDSPFEEERQPHGFLLPIMKGLAGVHMFLNPDGISSCRRTGARMLMAEVPQPT